MSSFSKCKEIEGIDQYNKYCSQIKNFVDAVIINSNPNLLHDLKLWFLSNECGPQNYKSVYENYDVSLSYYSDTRKNPIYFFKEKNTRLFILKILTCPSQEDLDLMQGTWLKLGIKYDFISFPGLIYKNPSNSEKILVSSSKGYDLNIFCSNVENEVMRDLYRKHKDILKGDFFEGSGLNYSNMRYPIENIENRWCYDVEKGVNLLFIDPDLYQRSDFSIYLLEMYHGICKKLADAIAILHGLGLIINSIEMKNIIAYVKDLEGSVQIKFINLNGMVKNGEEAVITTSRFPPEIYLNYQISTQNTKEAFKSIQFYPTFSKDIYDYGYLMYCLFFSGGDAGITMAKLNEPKNCCLFYNKIVTEYQFLKNSNLLPQIFINMLDLMIQCLNPSPDMRPTIQEIQRSNFLSLKLFSQNFDQRKRKQFFIGLVKSRFEKRELDTKMDQRTCTLYCRDKSISYKIEYTKIDNYIKMLQKIQTTTRKRKRDDSDISDEQSKKKRRLESKDVLNILSMRDKGYSLQEISLELSKIYQVDNIREKTSIILTNLYKGGVIDRTGKTRKYVYFTKQKK